MSLSVKLSTGKSAHITFSPLTGGGSTFVTDNAMLQRALEAHPKYGKLFKAVQAPLSRDEGVVSSESGAGAPLSRDEGVGSSEEVSTTVKIEVSCLDDAKEYLVEKFGISRTKLRSTKAIKEAAAAHDIEFVGI